MELSVNKISNYWRRCVILCCIAVRILMFKKDTVIWLRRLHDTITIENKSRLGYLKNPLIHHNYVSLEQYFYKFNFYTTQSGLEEYKEGSRVSKFNFCAYFMFKPLLYFLRKYFLLKSCKDGFRGFFISLSSSLLIFTTYAKLWEIQGISEGNN